MTRTPLTDEDLFSALDAEQYFGTLVEASASLGMSPQAYRYRLTVAKNKLKGYEPNYGEPLEGFSTPLLPTDQMPTDELTEPYDPAATISVVMPRMPDNLSLSA